MLEWLYESAIDFEPRLYQYLACSSETSGNSTVLRHASGRIGDAPVI
jgi:hypothetical protein